MFVIQFSAFVAISEWCNFSGIRLSQKIGELSSHLNRLILIRWLTSSSHEPVWLMTDLKYLKLLHLAITLELIIMMSGDGTSRSLNGRNRFCLCFTYLQPIFLSVIFQRLKIFCSLATSSSTRPRSSANNTLSRISFINVLWGNWLRWDLLKNGSDILAVHLILEITRWYMSLMILT